MVIKPFLDSHRKSLHQLCELLNNKYHYNNILPDILSSENFEGFVAISENNALAGFVGVVFMPSYAYLFGLRVHPNFFKKGIGLMLAKYVSEYALKKSPIIRLAFLSDNKAAQKITLADGWDIIGNYFILTAEAPFDSFTAHNKASAASIGELDEIVNFITGIKIGQKKYDEMFLNDLIWHPIASSGKILEKLIFSQQLLIEKIGKRINAVCIIKKNYDSNSVLEIPRLWGKPESLIGFIIENYRPQKIKICVGETEKEKWQKMGFSTTLAFYNDELFESKYTLSEKKRRI